MEIPSRMVHVEGGAGWHEATCHPRLGGACEARALCREGRRGSPVAPCPATRRKGAPWPAGTRKGAPWPAGTRKGCDRTGQDGTARDRTARDRTARDGMGQKKEGGSNESPSRKTAATYSPNWCVSTIGVDGLNFSVRNGKRWVPGAIATAI